MNISHNTPICPFSEEESSKTEVAGQKLSHLLCDSFKANFCSVLFDVMLAD